MECFNHADFMMKVEEETVTFNDFVWYFSKYLPRFFDNTIISGDSEKTIVIAIREEDDIEYKTLVSVYINEDNKFVFKEERYEIIGRENNFVDSLNFELRLKSKGKKNFDKFWIPFIKRGYYYA